MNLHDSGRKVVLVRGDANKWYEQAIFILRESAAYEQIDFVKEAEKIINGQTIASQIIDKYENNAPAMPKQAQARENNNPNKRNKRKSFDVILNIALIIAAATVLALLYFNFWR